MGLIVYLTTYVIWGPPTISLRGPPSSTIIPLIFSGHNGGGGGNLDPLPASRGNLPRASLDTQIVPPTVIVPKEMPKLPSKRLWWQRPTSNFPQGGQIGDPTSQFSQWLSNGPGGPGGIGPGCCGGVGSSTGPYVGNGPPGIFTRQAKAV